MTVLFADDTHVLLSGDPNNVAALLEKVREVIQRITNWSNLNYQQLNLKKTQFMVIGNPRLVHALGSLKIRIDDAELESVSEMTCLGLKIDHQLTWSNHVNKIQKSCNATLFALYPLERLLTPETKKVLVNALILPILSYMVLIWGTCGTKTRKLAENILRRAGRFVFALGKYDSVKLRISKDLGWLFPEHLHTYEVIKTGHRISSGCVPYFPPSFLLDSQPPSIRTRNKNYYPGHPNSFLRHHNSKLDTLQHSNIGLLPSQPFNRRKLKENLLAIQVLENECDEVYGCDLSCIDDVINRMANTT